MQSFIEETKKENEELKQKIAGLEIKNTGLYKTVTDLENTIVALENKNSGLEKILINISSKSK